MTDDVAKVSQTDGFDHDTGVRPDARDRFRLVLAVGDQDPVSRCALIRANDGGAREIIHCNQAPGVEVEQHGPLCLARKTAKCQRPAWLDDFDLRRQASGLQGDGKGEDGAFSQGAGERPLAVHGPNQTVADCKAQTGASMGARRALVLLGESFEEGGKLVFRDAGAGVMNRHTNPMAGCRVAVDGD